MVKLSEYREVEYDEINEKADIRFSLKTCRWQRILAGQVGKKYEN